MATAAQTLEKMREICLSLPDTREGDHFGHPVRMMLPLVRCRCLLGSL